MKHLKLLLALLMLSTFLYASEEIPTQEEVAKLYVATFNRAPDSAGLTYWTTSSGLKLSQIAQSFFDQPETQTLYPADTLNRDFINSVYQNLFNREPDTAGWNYWENELNTGAFTKNRFIEAVINGAQNTIEYGNDAIILTNKTIVGLSFSEAGLDNVEDAKTIMIGISDDTSTVTSALSSFGISLYVESTTPIVGAVGYQFWKGEIPNSYYYLNIYGHRALKVTGKPWMVLKYDKISGDTLDCEFGLSEVTQAYEPNIDDYGTTSQPTLDARMIDYHVQLGLNSPVDLLVSWNGIGQLVNGVQQFSFNSNYVSMGGVGYAESWSFTYDSISMVGGVKNIDNTFYFYGADSETNSFNLLKQ